MYVLTEDDSVILEYEGVAGEDTIVDAYQPLIFRYLAGTRLPSTVCNREMWLAAKEFTPSDFRSYSYRGIQKRKGNTYGFH